MDNAGMQQEIELRKPDDEVSKIAHENWQVFMLKRQYMLAWMPPDGEQFELLPPMIAGPAGWIEADPDRIANMLRARWQ
jgi:hypothetical protein